MSCFYNSQVRSGLLWVRSEWAVISASDSAPQGYLSETAVVLVPLVLVVVEVVVEDHLVDSLVVVVESEDSTRDRLVDLLEPWTRFRLCPVLVCRGIA